MADWLDLTHPLRTGLPVFPGDPLVRVRPCCTHARDGFQVSALDLGTHSGTHMDAPLHFIPGGRSLDTYPPERFFGRGWVVDACGAAPGAPIGPAVLEPLRGRLDGAGMVLFHTGWDRYWGQDAYYRHPYLTADLARALVSLGVRLVGVDTLNPDATGGEAYPVHRMLLGADLLIVENLTGLAPLAGQAAEFCMVPLKVAEGDGAPIRALGRRLG